MRAELYEKATVLRIPDASRIILACGDDAAAVRAVFGARDFTLRTLELSEQPRAFCHKDPRGVVLARRHNVLAVSTICRAQDPLPMALHSVSRYPLSASQIRIVSSMLAVRMWRPSGLYRAVDQP